MKRAVLGTALGAVLALGGTATAAQKPHHKAHHKCGKSKAFVVKGVFVGGTVVVDDAVDAPVGADGLEGLGGTVVTDDGVAGFDVTGANRHARDAGHGPDSANDPGSYLLSDPEDSVKLSGYADGDVPDAGDKIRVIGKVAVAKNGCAEASGAVSIRKIKVIDSDAVKTDDTDADAVDADTGAEAETETESEPTETVDSESSRGTGKSGSRGKGKKGKS